jgi:hypothetical protein
MPDWVWLDEHLGGALVVLLVVLVGGAVGMALTIKNVAVAGGDAQPNMQRP